MTNVELWKYDRRAVGYKIWGASKELKIIIAVVNNTSKSVLWFFRKNDTNK